MIILKWNFKKWEGGRDMDSTDLAQNRNRGWAVVKVVTERQVP
jgi:hypothetical protein